MYSMKVRKPGQWFYRTLRLTAHRYVAEHDKMVCTFEDGSVYELPGLSKCELRISKATLDELNKLMRPSHDDVSGPQEPNDK